MDTKRFEKYCSQRVFEKRVYLASPTMHGDELDYIHDAFTSNWVSTIGENINVVESSFAQMIGKPYAVALSAGTGALHLAVRACAERLYGTPASGRGSLIGKKVFCSDLTFAATVNPVLYEGGEPIFIDSEYATWNMDPEALERAFQIYPDVRMVVVVHLYGTPAQIDRIREICDRHQALMVEDAAESLGATYQGKQTGSFGDIGVISFNGNKIITGSCGGLIITDNRDDMLRIRKWSTQSRDPAAWYQHTELGYNYRMSNIVAGVIRGQLPYLQAHIREKQRIYNTYREGLHKLPVSMNPYDAAVSTPNHWLSCLLIDREAMCGQTRTDETASYQPEPGKSCPTELLEAIAALNAEGRPIWKPMHLQPIYQNFDFINADGSAERDVGADIFRRGICLPSDIKMTPAQMEVILGAVAACFSEDC